MQPEYAQADNNRARPSDMAIRYSHAYSSTQMEQIHAAQRTGDCPETAAASCHLGYTGRPFTDELTLTCTQ